MQRHKVAIVVFDALRPDHVDATVMPRLAAFLAAGVVVVDSRTVFPSATRVATSAFSTGSVPAVHGLVANRFLDPEAMPERPIDTGSRDDLLAAAQAAGGYYLTAPTMGELIGHAGLEMAVHACGSGGTTWLLHPSAERFGHTRLSLRAGEQGAAGDLAKTVARFGPVPRPARPNAARVAYLARIVVDRIERGPLPDLTVTWFNDPDSTWHYEGLGSSAARAALAAVDQAFGQILDALAASPEADRIQIVAMSDHGQVVARRKIDVKAALARAGLRFAPAFGPDVDYAGSLGSVGAIRVRDGDPRLAARLAAALRDQDWCGLLFSRGGAVPGSLDLADVMLDHRRAPDLVYVMSADPTEVIDGVTGATDFDGDVPEGGGMHGGLCRQEIHNLMAFSGSAFRTAARSAVPAGIVDIAPTILKLLGLEAPASMSGRPLVELFADGGDAPEVRSEVAEVDDGGRVMRLTRWRVMDTAYIARAEVA